MVNKEVDRLMKKIQATSVLKGIRVEEFFKDFDHLRSGYVTKSQFMRCMGMLGVYLSEKDMEALYSHYGESPQRVNYRVFADDVNAVHTTKNLEKTPAQEVEHANAKISKDAFVYQDKDTESKYFDVALKIAKHCQKYGLSIRAIFASFDKTNRGWVTASQFDRYLPIPESMSEFDVRLVVERFRRNDLCNYLAFHKEIEGQRAEEVPLSYRYTLQNTRTIEHTSNAVTTTNFEDLIRALQIAFLKTRVRPIDYMRDYDKLRSSYITANQFECGLSLASSAPGGLRLSRPQVQVLVDHFKNDDGKVNYASFCKQVDGALYTGREDDLINDPLAEVPTLRKVDVTAPLNALGDEAAEKLLDDVLARIRRRIDERGLDLYPQFRDFDRRHAFTKGVTRAQFQRLLDMTLTMPISEAEYDVLCTRYLNPETGHVNYTAFIADVDEDAVLANPTENEKLYVMTGDFADFKTLNDVAEDNEVANAQTTLNRVKLLVAERSLRVAETLRDFDPLRKGFITRPQFKRGVGSLLPILSEGELNALADTYTSTTAAAPRVINWRDFVRDIDHMHVEGNALEATPTARARDLKGLMGELKNLNELSLEERGLRDEDEAAISVILDSIRAQAIQLRLSLGDPFFSCDPTRRGKLPPAKFARCVDMTRVLLNPQDVEVLAQYYLIANGEVDYAKFLRDVAPHPSTDALTEQTQRNLQQTLAKRNEALEDEDGGDVSETLYRINNHVVDRRVRLNEHFRDFDRLRKGRVSKANFRSALSMCGLTLTPKEYAALENEYPVDGYTGFVNYAQFIKDVDASFGTTHLHLDPTKPATQYKPPQNVAADAHLRNETERQTALRTEYIQAIADKMRARGIDILDDLEDFDKYHNGQVSVAQFQRVLGDAGLYDAGISEEKFDALVAQYLVGRHMPAPRVHYKTFLQDVDAAISDLHAQKASS